MPIDSCIRSLNEYKTYKDAQKRFISFVSVKTASNGSIHASTNVYDDVLKWITYPKDYILNTPNVVYRKGYGYNI